MTDTVITIYLPDNEVLRVLFGLFFSILAYKIASYFISPWDIVKGALKGMF
jgi:hypothetical protein